MVSVGNLGCINCQGNTKTNIGNGDECGVDKSFNVIKRECFWVFC